MRKAWLFIMLYLFSLIRYLKTPNKKTPLGLHGKAVFLFHDPYRPGPLHGVVAFVLPEELTPDELDDDLWGPFGYSSSIDRNGIHLYGRDTWGVVDKTQINENPVLARLSIRYPGQMILLAGVRKIFRMHIYPLNVARYFVLKPRSE